MICVGIDIAVNAASIATPARSFSRMSTEF